MDWRARTYIVVNGWSYRIKVFDRIVTVEPQFDDENRLYPRQEAGDIYNGQGFNMASCTALIARYEVERQSTPYEN